MTLSSTTQQFVLHWGEMGTRWGVNRSIAQIHALLYLTQEPLDAEAISETLGIARSNVSTSLRELQGWNLVSRVHVLGERRDRFEATTDPWEMLFRIADGRKRREFDPLLSTLDECRTAAAGDRSLDPEVLARMDRLLTFLRDLDRWYEDIRHLPIPTIRRLMTLGRGIARLLPGGRAARDRNAGNASGASDA